MRHRLRWSSLGITAGLLGLLFGVARASQADPCPQVIYRFDYLKGTSPELQLFSDPGFSSIDPDVNLTAPTPTSTDFPPLQLGEYKEIGTWRTGVLFDAGCLDVYTWAYQPHVWIGSQDTGEKDKGKDKNKDEDAPFDLKAELFMDDDLVAEGEVLCITGLTRKPADKREIVIPFPSPASLLSGRPTTRSQGFYLHNGSELFLRLSARISENEGKCHVKKDQAGRPPTGLRLDYFAAAQPARVLLFGAAVCGQICIDLSAPYRD